MGERVCILPDPPQEQSAAGIIIPEAAKHRPYSGRLVSAGLSALDKYWDHGIEIGDTVWYGKFAGVYEEWDHIVQGEMTCTSEDGEHSWERTPAGNRLAAAFKCSLCNAVRHVEYMIVANCDDVYGSVEQEERFARGELVIERRTDTEGRTCHVYVRKELV